MNSKIKKVISDYFTAVNVLQETEIIQSKNYSADIYNSIAKDIFGYTDFQLFSNNCPYSQPLRVGTDISADLVLIVLGPKCNLKPIKNDREILFYQVFREEISKFCLGQKGPSILTKDFFEGRKPDNKYQL